MTLTDPTTSITTPGLAPATRTWTEPTGIAPRGTVVVLVGRGETPEVYERLGRRLAADAYRVIALDEGPGAGSAAATAAAADLLADDDLPAPRVLLGSDAGALLAVELARAGAARVDAVVLAGLPTRDGSPATTWEAEIAARTACPNHRGVLGRAARGTLADATHLPVAALVASIVAPAEGPEALDVPLLAVHGGRDDISPVDDAVAAYRRLGAQQVAVVEGGLHDILNDVSHRSVAATIVLFLERLRLGNDLPVLVRDATAASVPTSPGGGA